MVQNRRKGGSGAPRRSYHRRPMSFRVLCAGCGKEIIVEVAPPSGKKLHCMECFKKVGAPA